MPASSDFFNNSKKIARKNVRVTVFFNICHFIFDFCKNQNLPGTVAGPPAGQLDNEVPELVSPPERTPTTTRLPTDLPNNRPIEAILNQNQGPHPNKGPNNQPDHDPDQELHSQ